MPPSTTMHKEKLNNENICEIFAGASVLVTGGTGFLGKALVEKLIRSCSDLNAIYMIVRPKNGIHPQQRINDMFSSELFTRMKESHPKWENKIICLAGDCCQPSLGLSMEDRLTLVNSVNFVFHSAATVRFDEDLKTAVGINVKGTKYVLELAREIISLKGLVHVSTAFANCPRDVISEVVYPAPMPVSSLLQITDCLEENLLEKLTSTILREWPNTYVFTKQIAEDVVTTAGIGLPVSIFRPAIVVSSQSEPMPGWTDNLYGASGIMVGTGTGVLRTLQCNEKKRSDIVPVDLAVNAMIATAWKTSIKYNESNNPTDYRPEVYNFVTSLDNPVTWKDFRDMCIRHAYDAPPYQAIWDINLSMQTSRAIYLLQVLFLQFLPAFLIDSVSSLFGKSPNLLKIHKKIQKFSDILAYFTLREWNFETHNVKSLWQDLCPEDRILFPFDMTSINWDDFFKNYTQGLRKFVLKEDPSSIPYARLKMKVYYWAHCILKFGLYVILIRISANFLFSAPISSLII